jgi:hypothetical protein
MHDQIFSFRLDCLFLSIEPDVSTSTSTSSLADDIKTCAPTSNSLSQEAHKILIDQQFPGIDILKIYNYSNTV